MAWAAQCYCLSVTGASMLRALACERTVTILILNLIILILILPANMKDFVEKVLVTPFHFLEEISIGNPG